MNRRTFFRSLLSILFLRFLPKISGQEKPSPHANQADAFDIEYFDNFLSENCVRPTHVWTTAEVAEELKFLGDHNVIII